MPTYVPVVYYKSVPARSSCSTEDQLLSSTLVLSPNLSQSVVSTVSPPAHLHSTIISLSVFLSFQAYGLLYLRKSLTTGLHFTTPGGLIPSEGGLHEYCMSSISAHLWRSIGSPLRRFSLKALCTIWMRSGSSEVEKMGTRGAIGSFFSFLLFRVG